MAKKAADKTCILKRLPEELTRQAAKVAVEVCPTNLPRLDSMAQALAALVIDPDQLAVLVNRYWTIEGVSLGVSFLDSPPAELRDRILSHMNSWGETAKVKFSWSQSQGQVRITRSESGYWSYLGTDILLIPQGQATMSLEGFSASTSEAEYKRVVRHETGHTLGFPHEHLRQALVAKLDVAKTIAYFRNWYGWSEATTRSNVLTPLEDRSIMGSDQSDELSVMCYSLPASITRDGKAIKGGADLSETDRAFAGKVYPLPPPPVVLRIDVPSPIPAGSYQLVPE